MGRPNPGSAGPEEWEEHLLAAMELAENDHFRICTWIQEEGCAGFTLSTEGSQHQGEEAGVGRKHVLYAVEGG